jgi:hypothetical protein
MNSLLTYIKRVQEKDRALVRLKKSFTEQISECKLEWQNNAIYPIVLTAIGGFCGVLIALLPNSFIKRGFFKLYYIFNRLKMISLLLLKRV